MNMETKPPIRQRVWYGFVWAILILISGAWTIHNAYWGYQLITHPPGSEEEGLGALCAEVLLVISIPVYILFMILLFVFPVRRKT